MTRLVNSFEANLLQILQGFLGRRPLASIKPLLLQRRERPPSLSRDCVELVQDVLAKGCVTLLARRGGWRRERFLRGGRPVEGRLWRRSSPEELGLAFSSNTLDFLTWVAAVDLAEKSPPPWRRVEGVELTLGDRFLIYRAHRALRPAPELRRWRRRFAGHPLCRLSEPADFSGAKPLAPEKLVRWVDGPGAAILEALQGDLAEGWVRAERGKGRIVSRGKMLALGQTQEQTLQTFLQAADAAGRRDLARFVLVAAAALLAERPAPAAWTASLDVASLRMAERTEAYRAATAFLRALQTLQAWRRQAQHVGFLDEGYAASQLWKADWERLRGDELCRQALAVVTALDPLRGAAEPG